ncbi:MAG: VTT domain-containing protein [Candidatus Paceibacterota bacterium]
MESLKILDPHFLISVAGLVGVVAIVFAESGLFFGFFLPGDSLLFTAGLLASQGYFNFWFLLFGVIIAAISGDSVGYFFGKKVGPAIFKKEDSRFFKKKYVEKAHSFYEKHGNKTIIFARFIPVIRTFAPIVAGVVQMNYKNFFIYNCIGGIFWSILMVGGGFILGEMVPSAEKYLMPIIIFIIATSFIPGILKLLKHGKGASQ